VGVGACRPDQREMPTPLIARARVYVDSRQGALKEAGDLLIPIREGAVNDRHIVGELGELVSGKVAGRIAASGVTIFKSLGMAVEDVVAAQLALERAKVSGLGQSIEFR
jgi:ornithine cyclodeaminase